MNTRNADIARRIVNRNIASGYKADLNDVNTYQVLATDVAIRKVSNHHTREFVRKLLVFSQPMGLVENMAVNLPDVEDADWYRFVSNPATTRLSSVHGINRVVGEALAPNVSPWGTGHVHEISESHPRIEPRTPEPADFDVPAVANEADSETTKVERATQAFVPSDNLVLTWIEGINSNLSEAGETPIVKNAALEEARYRLELTKQLNKIFNNFAKRKAYEGGPYRITFGRKLYPSVENLIIEHLMMPPRHAVPFLDEFLKCLFAQSRSGAVFSGKWGSLVVDDANELVLDLNKRKRRRLTKVLSG